MLDIYILIVPVIGLLIFITLIVLKYTLAQPKFNNLSKYQRKAQKVQNNNAKRQQAKNNDQLQQTGYKKTLKYLLKNYTLTQFYFIRRSRNKIPFLLSISTVTMMSYIFDIQYIFSILGGIICIIYAFGKMLANQYQPDTNNSIVNPLEVKQKQKMENKLQIILTCITICLDLFLLGLLYKNYRNAMLINSSMNLLINLALDNFVVKPILLMIFAIPIRNVQFVDDFINYQIQILQILQQIRIIKQNSIFISAMSPRKHRMSPSKVPKAILQIQAKIKSQQKQKYLSTFQLHKGIRKQKLSPLSLRKKNHHNQQGNNSLISLFNSSQKKNNKKQYNESFDNDSKLQSKVQQQNKKNNTIQSEQTSKFSFQYRKKNKLYSSKAVLINAQNSIINGLDVQNQQEQDFRTSSVFSNNLKIQKSQKSLKDNDSKLGQNDQIQLISLNNCLNDEIKMNQSGIKDQSQSQFNQMNRAISSLEEQSIIGPSSIHTSRKIGLLKIHEDKNGQDLEEIDLNSPQRRRDQLSRVNQQGDKDKIKKKKTHKKYSLDPNRHVIKHTTGEPYLEFLPNLLNKQRQQKKKRTQQFSQQQFSRKVDLLNNDSRFSKSVKRTKNNKDPIVRQNDENRIPEFMVQDFQS